MAMEGMNAGNAGASTRPALIIRGEGAAPTKLTITARMPTCLKGGLMPTHSHSELFEPLTGEAAIAFFCCGF